MQEVRLLADILGGPQHSGRAAPSLSDFDKLVRKGFPWKSASQVKEALDLSDERFASLLEVGQRTLARWRKDKRRLNLQTSDRLFRLVRIFSLAHNVLEGREPALEWLRSPQIGLGGGVPLDLIRTEAGAREVEDLLGRIEYGVLS